MWVRFWSQYNGSSIYDTEESRYELVSDRETDESLSEMARDAAPMWMRCGERGFSYGFERLDRLPDNVKQELTKKWQDIRTGAEKMLKILEK